MNNLGEYVPQSGRFVGKKLDDCCLLQLDSYVGYLEDLRHLKPDTRKNFMAIKSYLALPHIKAELEKELEKELGT